MELSAAEEYALKIIAAESALQHAARDDDPASMPEGEASYPTLAASETVAPASNHLAASPSATTPPSTHMSPSRGETKRSTPASPASVPPVPDGLWPAVRDELKAQSVIGYPANAIESLGLSPADQAEYLARAGKNLSSWYRLMMAQDSVLAEFRQAGIPVAVLKGAAAAANYPQPNSRSMGDIDLIVPPVDFDRAFTLLEDLGWENEIPLEINPRHAGFKKAGCPEIELHRYFSTCTNKQQAHFLDQAIYDVIPHVEWTDVAGFNVPVLPPLANGLVLLAHVNQHLGSGLGLRQILDWQMFAAAQLTDEFWESEFQHAAQQIGMEKLAVTTTWLCRTYLGLQTSATWFDCADAQLADDLLLYITRKGNMGRKVERGAQATRTVLHSFRSPAALVHYLYEGGRAHWEPARKHAWLAPAACLYQVGHVIRKGLARKVDARELVSDARSAQEEVDLLKRLEVTRM
ncbi:nucleotidyltransferase family protein [uncultured Ellagibacter sp.]|uniref:nucleotidyltransferase family protein n=1 Tax=uncultured Ellagibacter sp. TaxID=2137580 RepID=UPI0026089234|nr:nucleotidyltransferase family protein [uncultured Ellagibacter sp.]